MPQQEETKRNGQSEDDVLKSEIKSLESRLGAIHSTLEEAGRRAQEIQAELGSDLETFQEELSGLTSTRADLQVIKQVLKAYTLGLQCCLPGYLWIEPVFNHPLRIIVLRFLDPVLKVFGWHANAGAHV